MGMRVLKEEGMQGFKEFDVEEKKWLLIKL